MATALPPVPLKDINRLPYSFQEWLRKIQTILNTAGIAWTLIDFTGSDLADIETRNHNDLENIQGGAAADYYHLTGTQATDLTDGGTTTLHTHAASTITGFVEEAQDAVGAMVDSTLVYVDVTPLLTRAALTGDATAPQASNVLTLATVNANVGTFGSANLIPTITVNAKGLTTAVSTTAVGAASAVTVANEATDTTCFPIFVTAATGDLGPKSNASYTLNSNTAGLGVGSLRATGGDAPTTAADAVHAWVTGGIPVLTWVNPSNAANSRFVDFIYGGTGTFSGRYVNDALSSATSWVDVVGTSSAITSVTFPNGTVAITNTLTLGGDTQLSRIAANRIGVPDSISFTTGGVAPSVAASNLNLWCSTNSTFQDFVDSSQAANARIANFTFQSGSFVGRYINDAYNAATNWVTVVGTSAAITSITFPLITVTGVALFDGNVTLGNAAADTITVTGTPAGQVVGSTYTPTRSAEANLDANVTMSQAQYMRVGASVTVSGTFTADPTLTATATSFEITLPIASNIGAIEDVAGVAFCGAVAGMGAQITGVVANDTAKITWVSSDINSQTWSYTFTYQII